MGTGRSGVGLDEPGVRDREADSNCPKFQQSKRRAASRDPYTRALMEAWLQSLLAALAQAAGLSPHHFQRLFKAHTGVTPRAYAEGQRARRLRARLTQAASVTEAIYDAGFNAPSRFYENARELIGMTPSRWRAGGAGETIRFALGQCSLGAILVAESDQGICSIALGDAPEPLLAQLQAQFPRADLVGGDAAFERRVAQVVGFVEQPALGLELPLGVRGSAFQQRVWQALRAVPAGQTLSYAELARRIGQPRAARAVARACASNVLAVAIPCHRVVRGDGALAGYRWGVARKQALLESEGWHEPALNNDA